MKLKEKKSKKGDISITIFVLGVVAICILTILTFFISANNSKENFVSVGIVEKINSFSEEIVFYKNLGKNPEQEMNLFREDWFKGDFTKNITVKIEDGFIEGVFIKNNQRIILINKSID